MSEGYDYVAENYPVTKMTNAELIEMYMRGNGVVGGLRNLANKAIKKAIEDGQVIIAPGQIEG